MSKKIRNAAFKLIDIIVLLTMVLGMPGAAYAAPQAQDLTPVLATDKADYALGESAHITGTGFAVGDYSLAINGEEWGTVTVPIGGNFAADSSALDSDGNYEVRAYSSPWSGDWNELPVASASFTVAAPPPPTDTPTEPPTATEPPTEEPTQEPTATEPPTEEPTATQAPTDEPTQEPTATEEPTQEPTAPESPTATSEPTETPTPSGPPTIASDHPDYSPGSQVVLTGTNWQGDIEVRIIVNDDVGQTWRRDVIVSVATDGTVQDIFNLPSHFVANYSVTVRGLQTDRVATTTFTDAQEDYKHYADKSPASWQNGALQGSNSQYFEGEVVPHYWKTEGLTPGSFYAFNIYYDYYDPSSGGFCGFDFMAQYNLSRTPPTVGPPTGSGIPPSPNAPIVGGPGNFYTVNANIVGLIGPVNFGVQRYVQVRFQAASPKAEFYWGLHLAQPGAVSGCQGAKAWPGASLQSDVRATPVFPVSPTIMLGGGGSMQINPNAVIRGTISGFKWNDLNGNGVFDAGEPKLSGWTIRLCADSACATVLQTTTTDGSGNYTFNVSPGTYFVQEVLQAGWSQTFPGSGFHGGLTVSVTTPAITNMNFGNRQASSITIVKDANPNDSQDFSFVGDFGTFFLDDDSNPTLSNTQTFTGRPPGIYRVIEASIPAGWDLTSITCNDPDGGTTFSNPQVNIDLDAGENITCTFTNTKRGNIIIDKVTNPGNDPTSFSFSLASGPSNLNQNFSLSDTSTPHDSGPILPGSGYKVSETVPAGWDLTSATCSDGSPVTNIDVGPGETVTCTFTNTKRGRIIVDKVTSPSGSTQSFNFDANGGTSPAYADFSLADAATPNNQELKPGSYSVTETVPSGWSLSNLSCSLTASGSGTSTFNTGSPPAASITLGAGDTVTCTFTNTQQAPALTLVKTATPSTYSAVGQVINYSYLVSNSGNVSLAGPVTVTDDKATVTCPNVNTVGNLNGFLDPGESVTCIASYTITQADLNAGSVTNTAQAHAGGTDSNTDTETVTAVQSPALTLVKTATPSTYSAVGQVINYSYLVTNSGNVSLAGPVTVTDDKATVTCPNVNTVGNLNGFLDPGESITCSATYTITQADLNAGSVTNTAQAHAGGTDSNTDTETVTAVQSPALTLVKSATPSTYDSVGDIISYSYLVTNSGNVSLAGPVTVTDDKATVTCPNVNTVGNMNGFLDPGELITCTASYTITQADIDAGSVTNTAQAHANGTDSNEDDETVTADQNPHLSITKDDDVDSYDSVGDVIGYIIVATNDGNTTLSSVTVTDPNANNLFCSPVNGSTLAPTESMTCTASHTITQADIDAGSYFNVACVDDGAGGATEACDDVTTPADQNPHLSITKGADIDSYDSVGDVISYHIIATNDGNTTLASVTVTDPNASGLSCTPANGSTLAPTESMMCTASHTITQADIDAGSYFNAACVDDGADGAEEACDDVTTPADQNPHLSISKEATEQSYDEVGDVINYTIIATNDGNTTLASVTVTDPNASGLTCTPVNGSLLAPGASLDCTASHTITQADIDAGSYFNAACVDDGVDGAEEACDDVTTPADQNPHLSITKDDDVDSYDSVGDVISYHIIATNDGNTTLSAVTVTDPNASGLTCTPANGSSLAPGASLDCTASHTITQADIDAGSYFNAACVDDGPEGATEACDDVTTPADQNPHLSISKVATEQSYDEVGDVINYTIIATNDGNTTLSSVTVTDPNASGLTCIPVNGSPLAPGESLDCTASHTITQADIDAGSYFNAACVDDGVDGAEEACDDVTTPADQNPHLSISKEADVASYDSVGDVISYHIIATNDGNTTLSAVTVTDPNASDLSCTPANGSTLAPGASLDCTASHTITQADIDAGSYFNAACVDDGPEGAEEACDDVTTPADQNPHLSITKDDDVDSYDSVGDVISYHIIATNDGNTTLSAVTVTDPNASGLSCTPANGSSLAPGASLDCTASHTITQADIDAGSYFNAACVDDGDGGATEVCDDVTTPADQNPHLSITKVDDVDTYDSVGDVINYHIIATNDGNTTLASVTVTDPNASGLSCTPANGSSLAPGASLDCSATHTITQADIDAGSYFNAACVDDGDAANSAEEACDDVTTPADQNPHLSITKEADVDSYDSVGDVISYTIVATNDGNVTLHLILVTDANADNLTCTEGNPVSDLAPGDSIHCTASHTITQADIDAGSYFNAACVDVDDGDGVSSAIEACDDVTTPADQNPAISINKRTNGSDGVVIPVGSPITWTYVVTNTGNVTLTNVTVTDDNGTPANTADDFHPTCPKTTLLPGESMTCTAGGTAVAGHYVNTGTTTGKPPVGDPVTDMDESDYFSTPRLIIIKHVVNNNGGTKTAADFTLDSGGNNDTPDNFAGSELGTTVTLDAGSYAVTESGPSGYTRSDSADCSGTIANGQTKTCTVTNDDQPGTLIVKKVVINDNGGTKIATDFTFQVNGGSAVTFQQDTDTLHGKNTLTVNAGTYNVTEPAVSGYTTTYSNCSNVAVANGATQTCTITNNDQPGTLIVKKVVINDNGGTKIATNFSFQVNGGSAVTFQQDTDTLHGKNTLTVNAGTYNVTEPAVAGYTTTYSNCSNVAVANGATQTCTITNNDQPGTLIVKKVVIGGTKTCANFSFSVNGGANTPFEADCQNDLTVNAGTYSVTEQAVAGYTTTYSNCSNAVIPNGGSATCTITNTFVDFGQIAPTGTTCNQYVNGTALDFDVFYASQGGVVQYGVQSNKINQTNPGVFFYYTGLSKTIAGSGPRTVYIDQSDNNATVGAFSATKNDVKLWLVTGTSCTQIQLQSNQITLGSGANAGDVQVNFTASAPAGSYYVISVQYTTGSVVNTNLGAARPTVKYTFTTNVGGGPIEETDTKGITLAPK